MTVQGSCDEKQTGPCGKEMRGRGRLRQSSHGAENLCKHMMRGVVPTKSRRAVVNVIECARRPRKLDLRNEIKHIRTALVILLRKVK